MATSKGPASIRNVMYNGKNSLLPPKSPFPSISPSFVDYIPSFVLGQKGIPKSREGTPHHQRTSSESCLIEEQPSWLDELLNEPETPVRRGGHRRSSSDSFAYVDAINATNLDYVAKDEIICRNMEPPSWGVANFDHHKNGHHASFYSDPHFLGKHKNRPRDVPFNSSAQPRGFPFAKEKSMLQGSKSASTLQETDNGHSPANEMQDNAGSHEPRGSSDIKESSHTKPSASETDTKRAKQQFAQRSRVRKLQYIAELERNVQTLQVEGADISAELEFLNQQNLILSMENKALKQRLESLTQEQLIKCLEQEVLEREIGRLRTLYKQQRLEQQQQQPSSVSRLTGSKDLDQQFASLSLRHKEATPGLDAISGQLNA